MKNILQKHTKKLPFGLLLSLSIIACSGGKEKEEAQMTGDIMGFWTRELEGTTQVLAFTESENAWADTQGKTPISQFFSGNYNNPDYPFLGTRGTWRITDGTLSFSNTWNDPDFELPPADLLITELTENSLTLENEKWLTENTWTRIHGLRNAPADMPFLGRFEEESITEPIDTFDIQDGRIATFSYEMGGWIVLDENGEVINSRTVPGTHIQLLGDEVVVGSATDTLVTAYALSDALGTWSWPAAQGPYDRLIELKRVSNGMVAAVDFHGESIVTGADRGLLFQWLDSSGNPTQQSVFVLSDIMDSLQLLSMDVGEDGQVVFGGYGYGQVEINGTIHGEPETSFLFFGNFDSSGNLLGFHLSPRPEAFVPSMRMLAMPNGDIGIVGTFQGQFTLGGVNWETDYDPDDLYNNPWDIYALRLRPDGTAAWAQRFEEAGISTWIAGASDEYGRILLVVAADNDVDFGTYTHPGGYPAVSLVLLDGCGEALWGEIPKETRDGLTYIAASTAGMFSTDEAFWVAADRGIRRYTGPRTGPVEDACAE